MKISQPASSADKPASTVDKTLKFGVEKLKNTGVKSVVLDSEVLLSAVLEKDKTFIYSHPEFELNKKQEKIFKKYIYRRANHEPVAYILEQKEFYGLNFK